MNTVGLYIHIPFCAKKCDYCDFYSLANKLDMVPRYVKSLKAHMDETAMFTVNMQVDTIYFGGGTPSLLGADVLCKLLKHIKKRFKVTNNAEITLEANPDSVDLKMLTALRKTGFNRISFGVQSADDNELSDIGRIHTFSQAVDAYDNARRAGFKNISLDIMYGLPNQTTEKFLESLKKFIDLAPEHISCYGLKAEEGTPMAGRTLPSDEVQADMYLCAVNMLKEAGYNQYEISNFAKGNMISQHNMKYWTLEPYIGFGPAASSDFGGKRYTNVKCLEEYISGIENSDTVITEMEQISTLDRAGEYIMLSARTVRGMSASEYMSKFRTSFNEIEKRLERFKKYGLVENEGDRWHLTPKGFFVSNTIISTLQEVLD